MTAKMRRGIASALALLLAASLMSACGQTQSASVTAESSSEASSEEVKETPVPVEEPSVAESSEESKEIPAESVPTPEPTATPIPPEPQEPAPEGKVKSILTGEFVDEEIGKRRPVAFMVDNVAGAFPHYGNASASVYVEAPVEADLTRECIIFEDYDDLERIGSLRSSRDYFISYALGFDCIYTHYGQAAYALPYLESDEVNNISGLMGYGGKYFYRSHDLAAPHNAQTSGSAINQAIADLGYRKELKDGFRSSFRFVWTNEKANMSDGTDALYVNPGFRINKSWFTYDEEAGLYRRFQYNGAEVDGRTGEQIMIKNIILEYENATTYQDSLYVHFDTVSGGKGKYISEGKAIDITWTREDFYSPAHYYREDGTELEMNPGKTWVSLIKKKDIGKCVIGTSPEDAVCVVSPEVQAQLEAENQAFHDDYKTNEAVYRAELDLQLAKELEAHGGISKVEQALYR